MALRETISEIRNDLPLYGRGLKSLVISYLFSPRFRLLLNYRIGKYFYVSKSPLLRLLALRFKSRMIVKRGCDISFNAKIGSRIKMPHPLGIVIGDSVVIKDDVTLFQQVTLGSHGKRTDDKLYPTIEKGVIIFAGAKIIGGINIGENAIVGANSVVNIDIPAGATAVGIPCKIIYK